MSSERLSQIIDFACKERHHGSSYTDIRLALGTYDLSKESITYVMKKVEDFDRKKRIRNKGRNKGVFKILIGCLALLGSAAIVYLVSQRLMSFQVGLAIGALALILLGVLFIFLGTKQIRDLKPLFK